MVAKADILEELPQGPYTGNSVIEWTKDQMRISVRLADCDRLGCMLVRLDVKPAPGARLRVDPESLAQKLGYLGETLVVIEQAKDLGRAVLRSSPPEEDSTHIYFFELVVDCDEGLSLVRYAYDRARLERNTITTPLTIHALGRLIEDMKTLVASA